MGSEFDDSAYESSVAALSGECSKTSQCKLIYGSEATDCKNSEGGVCFCGGSVCSSGETPPVIEVPNPTAPTTAKSWRLAYSCDGNQHDADDWHASPLSLALVAEGDSVNRMVHLDYNNHLGDNDAVRAKKHKDAVLGAASRYNYPASILFDDQSKLAAAVDHLAKVINESTSSSPLKLICAGPMEVCWQGLKKSDPSKHQYVTVISHSSWNDNHADTPQMSHRWKNITKDFKVKAEHIGDQNATAFKSTPSAWSWLKTTQGGTWLYTIVSTDEKAGDASDTGMVMYALNGNQKATMAQIRSYMGY